MQQGGAGDVAQIQQPNSNMTDRSVDSGVGSDVAMMDFMDDDHQVTALKDSKSPDKGHQVKSQGHQEKDATMKDKMEEVNEAGKKSKEKSPKDKSKKSKKSKTKGALKQPPRPGPSDVLAAEIAALKSPSDVPGDDLSMPFTLPGFEAFHEPDQQDPQPAKPDKHKTSSRSRKKSKGDKEKCEGSGVVANDTSFVAKDANVVAKDSSVVAKDADRSGENAPVRQQVDMLPDTITFTENELSDVLDQVESLGQSFSSTEETSGAPTGPTSGPPGSISVLPGSAGVKSETSIIMESVLDTPKVSTLSCTCIYFYRHCSVHEIGHHERYET